MKAWPLRGLAAFSVYFLLSSYLPLFWDKYLARFQLLELSSLGTIGGQLLVPPRDVSSQGRPR